MITKTVKNLLFCLMSFIVLVNGYRCAKNTDDTLGAVFSDTAIKRIFGNNININSPENYANQTIPAYINADNGRVIDDKKATLGRVLFYDKALSTNGNIACASCHQQEFGFSDTAVQSKGVNGLTGRHSMRLINARFAREAKFFWNERAATLEAQTTQPIQDHAEMGYSGLDGDPDINDLLAKLNALDYYQELSAWAYNQSDSKKTLSENNLQECLGAFIRSIQSFDSKYDEGRRQLANNQNNAPLPNFSSDENAGLQLFSAPPIFDNLGSRIAGGLGCGGCHRAPEFDIDPNTRNNGFVGSIDNPTVLDLGNTRSPSIRDLVNPRGHLNGPLMHTGSITSLETLIGHYNRILVRPGNNQIDPRLTPGGFPQQLNVTPTERQQFISFLETLTGKAIYTEAKWSNPFAL
jgi:cytochrome c peroxidase